MATLLLCCAAAGIVDTVSDRFVGDGGEGLDACNRVCDHGTVEIGNDAVRRGDGGKGLVHQVASCGLHILGLNHVKVGTQSTSRRSSKVILWVSTDHMCRESAVGDNYASVLGVPPYNGHG